MPLSKVELFSANGATSEGGAIFFLNMIIETLQGVLGSGENGVQMYREQGAWGQKDQGAGSKEE